MELGPRECGNQGNWRQGNKELRIQGNMGWSVQGEFSKAVGAVFRNYLRYIYLSQALGTLTHERNVHRRAVAQRQWSSPLLNKFTS